jgi:hypothetical protein
MKILLIHETWILMKIIQVLIPLFVLTALTLGLLLRVSPMKVLRIVMPWIILATSALGFVLGWSWDKKGRQYQGYYINEPELGMAISDAGNVLECVGVLGALVGIALLGAMQQLNGIDRRIRYLETEVGWLRRVSPALSTVPPAADSGESGGEFPTQKPGTMER